MSLRDGYRVISFSLSEAEVEYLNFFIVYCYSGKIISLVRPILFTQREATLYGTQNL
jgi:hypothetical protein